MTTNTAPKAPFIDVTDEERLINYVRFQLSQADEMLKPYVGADKPSFKVYHIANWRRKLQEELNSLLKK